MDGRPWPYATALVQHEVSQSFCIIPWVKTMWSPHRHIVALFRPTDLRIQISTWNWRGASITHRRSKDPRRWLLSVCIKRTDSISSPHKWKCLLILRDLEFRKKWLARQNEHTLGRIQVQYNGTHVQQEIIHINECFLTKEENDKCPVIKDTTCTM